MIKCVDTLATSARKDKLGIKDDFKNFDPRI